MRKLLLLLLVLSASIQAEPLIWNIEKGELQYTVIGSVHVGDKSMYPLPEIVFERLKTSQGLIVETDIRQNNGIKYPPTTLVSKDVLSTEQQNELIGISNLLELNANELLHTPPWATALAIQMKQIEYLGYSAADGVDTRLAYKATLWDKPVLSLESLQFQIDLLTGQKESGKELLISAIEEFDHSEDATHCLIESWKAGDMRKLEEFASLTQMSPDFEKSFLIDRNLDWAEKLSNPKWLPKAKGAYVIVVGTLHLIGEQSVLQLLKDEGFKVTQLSKSKASNCEFKY
ncbi:TraB/GumN family protein [Vibrio europaeus]|uniref:Polysaccharide biosynthesis protein GumN n=1 Tax=Vibrio europaeus TaxID=300876 RepID=A0A178JC48_9VIBR|nr:TraB/GumN family protein [Vibrio europaeus]MDC5703498.1 TraB/GumN family protein [Vibrio europaeus]MDC5711347.1 TraB/GumN family protein [Vibrio europaeus]MDC5714840.1 TraB/GumN family protein [Vibrio europaeus]MDC5722260.1 TraB/GumN family protein [Vibrio europaeus]MDC5727459.1 TraB/GumN family protein [Vibrio europaeus]